MGAWGPGEEDHSGKAVSGTASAFAFCWRREGRQPALAGKQRCFVERHFSLVSDPRNKKNKKVPPQRKLLPPVKHVPAVWKSPLGAETGRPSAPERMRIRAEDVEWTIDKIEVATWKHQPKGSRLSECPGGKQVHHQGQKKNT